MLGKDARTLDSQSFYGFYRGIVVDNKDPNKNGAVRLRVMPMFEGVRDNTLPWAIMADSSMGGYANAGGINVPEIGSHLFCFFENGDFRFPVYFAGAPSLDKGVPDTPELARQSSAEVTAINSATVSDVPTATGSTWSEPQSAYNATYPKNKVFRTAKGILLEIDDTDANTRIHVYHPSGTRMEIDNDGNEVHHVAGSDYDIVIGDHYVSIGGDQTTTVVNYELDATGNATVNIGGNCSLTVGGSATVTASGSVTVSGSTISLN